MVSHETVYLSLQFAHTTPGIKSLARKCIPGEEDAKPIHNGFAAYRATVDVERMKSDPETAWLLEKPALNIWLVLGSKNTPNSPY